MTQSDQVNFVPHSNPTFGIRTDYPSDWGRIDLSFLKNNSADIEFYPLDDSSGTKQVKIQVDTIPLDQKMTLQEPIMQKLDQSWARFLNQMRRFLRIYLLIK